MSIDPWDKENPCPELCRERDGPDRCGMQKMTPCVAEYGGDWECEYFVEFRKEIEEKPREVKFTPEAIESLAAMSPEDMKVMGGIIERISKNPEKEGQALSREEVEKMVEAGELPESALKYCSEGMEIRFLDIEEIDES